METHVFTEQSEYRTKYTRKANSMLLPIDISASKIGQAKHDEQTVQIVDEQGHQGQCMPWAR